VEEEFEKPEINLHQHQRHKRGFSWQFVFKIIIGIAVVAMMWYFAQLLMKSSEQEQAKPANEIEIEVQDQ